MKRLIHLALSNSFAMATVAMTALPRSPWAGKLLAISHQHAQRERMIIRFSSHKAIRPFRGLTTGTRSRSSRLLNPSSHFIIGGIEKRFERFSKMAPELIGHEVASRMGRDEGIPVPKHNID